MTDDGAGWQSQVTHAMRSACNRVRTLPEDPIAGAKRLSAVVLATAVVVSMVSGVVVVPGTAKDFHWSDPAPNCGEVTYAGSGTGTDPYEVGSVSELQCMGNASNPTSLGDDFALTSDIDASGTPEWNGGSGFIPVGNASSPFVGNFTGNGHAITGLTVNRSSTDDVGLFGKVEGDTTIRDVRLQNVDVVGNEDTGGLAGETEDDNSGLHPTVRNATVTGSVNGSSNAVGGLVGRAQLGTSGTYLIAGSSTDITVNASSTAGDYVGGLVGYAREPLEIRNSHASGDVQGDDVVGGLVGRNSARINDSYATGDVQGDDDVGGLIGEYDRSAETNGSYATGDVSGDKRVGGLIGDFERSADDTVINASYATGNVTGTGSQVGGLVGRNTALLNDTFATGDVNGSSDVGGLVGQNANLVSNDDGDIADSYAVGTVTSSDASSTGGLVGDHDIGLVEDSYWDVTTTGCESAVGDVGDTTSNLTGLSTSAMSGTGARTNMTALDFANTWNATTGNYPWLTESVSPNVSVSGPLYPGQTARTSVTLRREDGGTGSGTVSRFASNNTTVATVDSSGLVTAQAAGTTTISAVAGGGTATTTLQVNAGGTIAGTVTDGNGNPVDGLRVEVYQNESFVGASTTDATGYYSATVPPNESAVVVPEGANPGYEFQYVPGIPVSVGNTTTRNLTVRSLPDEGYINGTLLDASGNPVSNVRVSAHDRGYTEFASDTTDAGGSFSLRLTAGTYTVRAAETRSGPPVVKEGVSVTENGTTTLSLQYAEAGYINGSVSGASKPVFVVADTDAGYRVDVANARNNHDYNVTVPPGTHTVSVYARGKDAPSKEVSVQSGTNTETDFSLVTTEVVAASVEVTNGSTPADLGVRANVSQGLLQFQLVNESKAPWPTRDRVGPPAELDDLGVDGSTEFRINLTVTNFTANSLLWGIDDARWNATRNGSNPNATDITVTGSPVTLQANLSGGAEAETGVGPLIRKDPSEVQWPTGRTDQATAGRNQTVYAGIYDLSNVPNEARTTLDGVSATTNAQRFSLPTVENESLRVWVAAPSLTTDGNDHGGFYQATIPDSQLDEWGVEDPVVDLQALYKGQQRDFTVTDTADGARIRIENINYSAGVVEVETAPSASQGGDETGGGGGDPTPSSERFTNGQARVSFGSGADLRSVEVIDPNTDGRLDLKGLGTSFENVPEPAGTALARVRIEAPDPRTGTATVQVVLSDDLLSRHVVTAEDLAIRRYDARGGEWETLETTATDISDGVLFEAETDEFSVFAVATDGGAPEMTPTASPTPTSTPAPTATRTAASTATPAATRTTTETTPSGTATDVPEPGASTPGTTPTGSGGSGFGVAVSVVALLATVLVLRRPE